MPMDNPVRNQNALPEKPFQYRLWHLFVVMTVLAVVVAAFAQWGVGATGLLIIICFIGLATYSFVRRDWSLCLIGGIILFLVALLLPAVGSGPPSRRSICASNLRQIGVAL